jgi:hypothetical protein
MIIGCDFHPSFQQIAYVEQETHPSLPAGDPLPVLKAFTFLAARNRTKSHRTTNPYVREVLVGITDKCPVGRRALTRRPAAAKTSDFLKACAKYIAIETDFAANFCDTCLRHIHRRSNRRKT